MRQLFFYDENSSSLWFPDDRLLLIVNGIYDVRLVVCKSVQMEPSSLKLAGESTVKKDDHVPLAGKKIKR